MAGVASVEVVPKSIPNFTIGETTEKELTTLKNLVAHFIDAFAIDEDDIGKFTGFKYPLKLKPGAVPQYTNQYPKTVEASKRSDKVLQGPPC